MLRVTDVECDVEKYVGVDMGAIFNIPYQRCDRLFSGFQC